MARRPAMAASTDVATVVDGPVGDGPVVEGVFGHDARAGSLLSSTTSSVSSASSATDRGEAVPGALGPGALPEARGALPEARGALPEARGALPEARGALPEARGALPEARGALPEARGALPWSSGVGSSSISTVTSKCSRAKKPATPPLRTRSAVTIRPPGPASAMACSRTSSRSGPSNCSDLVGKVHRPYPFELYLRSDLVHGEHAEARHGAGQQPMGSRSEA